MTEPTNQQRADDGSTLTETYINLRPGLDNGSDLDNVMDALCALLHYARALGEEPEDFARIAVRHVEAEGEGGTDA